MQILLGYTMMCISLGLLLSHLLKGNLCHFICGVFLAVVGFFLFYCSSPKPPKR